MTIRELKNAMRCEKLFDRRGRVTRAYLCLHFDKTEQHLEQTSDEEMKSQFIADLFKDVETELDEIIKSEGMRDNVEGRQILRRLRNLREMLK